MAQGAYFHGKLALAFSWLSCVADHGHGIDVESLVRRQYEAFPYPNREPSSDNANFHPMHWQISLVGADHYIYNGELLERGKALRILIAGGGTGGETLTWAHNLQEAGVPGIVLHVDLSLTSIGIAKKWVSFYGLQDRVDFKQSSLEAFVEQYTAAGSHPFDIISCSGVLHHLKDPQRGLQLLQNILAPNGGLYLSVYGKHGRTGIYDLQTAFRYALPSDEQLSDEERLRELRKYLDAGLPDSNMCRMCSTGPNDTDAEIFDRFLHAQDRAYSFSEYDELVRLANLRIVTMNFEATYDPDYTIFHKPGMQSSFMARNMRNRTRVEQFHFTELITHRPILHGGWLVPVTVGGKTDTRRRFEEPSEWEMARRNDLAWRQSASLKLVQSPGLTEEQIIFLKFAAVARENSASSTVLQKAGMAVATVALPPLSFAFHEAGFGRNLTVEEIIQLVHDSAVHWRQDLPTSVPGPPLSYNEVSEQFFEWYGKMEVLGDLFSHRIGADVLKNKTLLFLGVGRETARDQAEMGASNKQASPISDYFRGVELVHARIPTLLPLLFVSGYASGFLCAWYCGVF